MAANATQGGRLISSRSLPKPRRTTLIPYNHSPNMCAQSPPFFFFFFFSMSDNIKARLAEVVRIKGAEARAEEAEERNRSLRQRLNLLQFIETCHKLMSAGINVRAQSQSTKGKTFLPKASYARPD